MKKISHDPLKLKGDKAEQIVHELAQESFFTDWCYLNPKLSDGKELCDLLIVFDNIAIIWSVKDSKLETREHNEGAYKQKDIEKSIRQLKGAKRQLFDLKAPIELENPRRGKEQFNPKDITEVYLISALMGEEGYFHFLGERLDDGTYIHNFTKTFVEILLNELDTISDFCNYFKEKESFLNSDVNRIMVTFGEENLLAYYLLNNRSFDQLKNSNPLMVPDGIWKDLIYDNSYKKKKRADEISYHWDAMINSVHTSKGKQYEKAARELARSNRFERRVLSKVYFDTLKKAQSTLKINAQKNGIWWHHGISLSIDGNTVYYFMFMPSSVSRENRIKVFKEVSVYAMGFTQTLKVIGIATKIEPDASRSYDFCVMEKMSWDEEDQKIFLEVQKEYNWFVKAETKSDTIDEYPVLR